jgi:integrase
MCTYLHGPRQGGTYYFRMGIPEHLRPVLGKREFFFSLRTKDRAEAKRRVLQVEAPHYTVLLEKAEAELAGQPVNAPAFDPFAGMTLADFEQHQRMMFEDAQRLADEDDRMEEADRIVAALPAHAPARLVLKHAEEVIERYREQSRRRKHRDHQPDAVPAPSAPQPSPVQQSVEATGIMLDTTVIDRWAAERGVVQKGKDTHKAVAKWFYERVGRKSVDLITRQDVLAFKDKLLAEGQSAANINNKLSRLRTLLGWAYQNDLVPGNVAENVGVKVPDGERNKRLPFSLADLQAIFSSPVYADGERPFQGRGEAAYWLPLLGLFTGARLEEIGQLRVADLQRHEYPDDDGNMLSGWFIHITQNTDENGQENRLKNAASERLVPVHPEIERLGFIAYVLALNDQGGRVFPDLKANVYGRLTAKWGEWFGPYMRTVCGVTDRRKVFHSFRHTFKDHLRRAKVEEGIQRQLMGHTGKDVADGYGSGYDLHGLSVGMASYRIAGLTLPSPA